MEKEEKNKKIIIVACFTLVIIVLILLLLKYYTNSKIQCNQNSDCMSLNCSNYGVKCLSNQCWYRIDESCDKEKIIHDLDKYNS